jgi:hypothetical protein
MSVEIGAQAAEIIRRLEAVDRAAPVIDRPRVEAALAEHLRKLDLPMMPVRWVDDAAKGWSAARAAAWSAARAAARAAAESAAMAEAEAT